MTKVIINCETGETVERELSKAEKDQQKIDETLTAQYEAAREQQAADKAALLERLGITAEEAQLLLGGN